MSNFVFGFSKWKKYWLEDYVDQPVYLDRFNSYISFFMDLVNPYEKTTLYVWSYKDKKIFSSNLLFNVIRVEDGFIRSKGLGSDKIKPLSLIFEKSDYLYFDSNGKSDIDTLISDVALTRSEKENSKDLLSSLKKNPISKYNLDCASIEVDGAAVLVIGQVEDDQAIIYGGGFQTNLELVELACKENPEKKVYYKRHPDVTSGNRIAEKRFDEILRLSTVIEQSLDIRDVSNKFDVSYVNTSLMGLEILIHGGSVRTVGKPFYWGLGLTDDYLPRCHVPIAIEELVYKVYVIFPDYHPENIIYKIKGTAWA
ncbi:MAG: hypothetical protein RPR97_15530 [Colwellia sp.]|jgi:Capsule polysaccharide export protein